MRQRRRTPRRRDAPRWVAAEWADATLALLRRSGQRCDKCGKDLGGRMERHHRQRRTVGGDRLSNLLALHPWCHAAVHAEQVESREAGWLVSWTEDEPGTVPVLIGGRWWLLDDDGSKAVTQHTP